LQPQDIWVTDLLTAVVDEAPAAARTRLVIGGDFNSSETFDHPRPRGNGLWLRQMVGYGFEEALRAHQGRLVPTFRDNRAQRVLHQMDHLFTSREIARQRVACDVVAPAVVFGQGLSDHLPIVADFR
jgi:endonuclease/exonuclease/phosphatase family metal-dependent hydrolase